MKMLGRIVLTVVLVAVIAFIAALVYTLTNGFSSDVKSFMLIRDGEYILSDVSGVTICEGETFDVYHYDDDEKISAKIVPIEIEGDYNFTIDGYEYSWNADVVRYVKDFSSYFAIAIDQDKNTVSISGPLKSALEKYAASLGGTLGGMQPLPSSDLFRIEISSDGSTIGLGCNMTSRVAGICLSQSILSFE